MSTLRGLRHAYRVSTGCCWGLWAGMKPVLHVMSKTNSMRRVVQLFCLCLLLIAQQTALTHATWHAAGADHGFDIGHWDGQSNREDHDENAPTNLCVYHVALGQVLGGNHGSACVVLFEGNTCAPCLRTFAERTSIEAIPAVSRGPPLLL